MNDFYYKMMLKSIKDGDYREAKNYALACGHSVVEVIGMMYLQENEA